MVSHLPRLDPTDVSRRSEYTLAWGKALSRRGLPHPKMPRIRLQLGHILVVAGLILALSAVAWELSVVLAQPVGEHAGHEPAIAAHSAAATAVVVVGILLATLGARAAIFRTKPASPEASALFVASALLFADGILHLDLVGEHLSILPFALVFVAAGALQIVLGFALFRARPFVLVPSVLVTLGLIVLFFVSRVTTVPFAEGPEEFEAVGALSKALEFGVLAALGFLLYRWRVRTGATATAPPVE